VVVGILDPGADDVARLETSGIAEMDFPVDLGRIGL